MNSQENSYDPPLGPSRRVKKLQAQRVARLEKVTDVSKKVLGYVRVSTEEQHRKAMVLMLRTEPSGRLRSRKALS